MSNLVATPGQSPDFDPRNVQTVRVRDLGATKIGNTDDEVDLRELWRALQRRKKLVAVTTGGATHQKGASFRFCQSMTGSPAPWGFASPFAGLM